ncbi:hypothetical protein J7K97_07500 [Candidatus Aerophobetes bacterium]|nr:hypothetical protein [Candidatus Aerophobetes bacterium]
MVEKYPINIWINDERYEKLRQAGLADMAEEVLAGMRVIKLQCTEKQKDEILRLYPMAKFDTATTKSIELIPSDAKEEMFNLVIRRKSLDVIDEFLKNVKKSG